jgi:predicted transcriptional regulator|tara:strand:+ start:3486 stop:3671 length:186 start_codon:yes stop_codon:yes gene_type:complete
MTEEQEWANLLAEVFDKLTAKHAAITYNFDNLEMSGVVERNGKRQPTGTVALSGKLTITTK